MSQKGSPGGHLRGEMKATPDRRARMGRETVERKLGRKGSSSSMGNKLGFCVFHGQTRGQNGNTQGKGKGFVSVHGKGKTMLERGKGVCKDETLGGGTARGVEEKSKQKNTHGRQPSKSLVKDFPLSKG